MCVLRVFGEEFDPAAALRGSTLSAYSVYRRGDPRTKSGSRLHEDSGFKVEVSEAEWSMPEQQFQDALIFLRTHSESLAKLSHVRGIDGMVLDFPIDHVGTMTFILIPVELSKASSALGIAIEISVYQASEEGSDE